MTASECRERIKNFCTGCANNYDGNCEETCEFPTISKALDLLEKQEQGLLIELPVPIGKKTLFDIGEYFTSREHAEMYEIDAREVTLKRLPKGKIIYTYDCLDYEFEDFGKIIFLTREEAEKRLAELRGELKNE